MLLSECESVNVFDFLSIIEKTIILYISLSKGLFERESAGKLARSAAAHQENGFSCCQYHSYIDKTPHAQPAPSCLHNGQTMANSTLLW